MVRKYTRKQPVEQLKEDIDLLQEVIDTPQNSSSFINISKDKKMDNKSPADEGLIDFKVRIDKKIRKLSREIYRKLKFDDSYS